MRKVKGVEIAHQLGISKATVSLALNGKPGVKLDTKRSILEMKHRLESGDFPEKRYNNDKRKIIKIIFAQKGFKIVYGSELDLWTDVLAVYDKLSKEMGYSIGVSYFDLREKTSEDIVKECEESNIVGIILLATEMDVQDYIGISKITKPMVITDNDFDCALHHRVCIDNVGAVKIAMDEIVDHHINRIHYLANGVDIFNFTKRREGYREYILHSEFEIEERIIKVGRTVEQVYEFMLNYLDHYELPNAFIMENYQVSIGTVRALRKKKIDFENKIRLIGIDEIPSYLTGDVNLTTIRIAHTDRANAVMLLLKREIESEIKTKFRIMSDCKLIPGQT